MNVFMAGLVLFLWAVWFVGVSAGIHYVTESKTVWGACGAGLLYFGYAASFGALIALSARMILRIGG